MDGKKIIARSFRGVGLIVTCVFAMLIEPLSLEAQQKATIPKIGYIRMRSKRTPLDEAFLQALHDLGYAEGKNGNIVIDDQFAGLNPKKLSLLVDNLLNDKEVKVVVALEAITARELLKPERKTAGPTIPIVIRVGSEYDYKNRAQNVTGFVDFGNTAELFAKRLELLSDVVPRLSHVVLLWNGLFSGDEKRFAEGGDVMKMLDRIKPLKSTKLESVKVDSPDEIESFFKKKEFRNAGPPYGNALIVMRNSFILENKEKILGLAADNKTPAIYIDSEFVEAGGLMSYGTDKVNLYREAAFYVDKILCGAKPATIPMRQANRFELTINLLTANRLGLKIAPEMLILAEKVNKSSPTYTSRGR